MEAVQVQRRSNRRKPRLHDRRRPVNLLIGPPADSAQDARMLSAFFGQRGKHIVCGGTTATLAARYLDKPLEVPSLDMPDPDVPPTGAIEGVDLVTEGVLTLRKALGYAQAYVASRGEDRAWQDRQDGASAIMRLLIEEATEVRLFVGTAENPAHAMLDRTAGHEAKLRMIGELADALGQAGKPVYQTVY